jgi:hypothetical protein
MYNRSGKWVMGTDESKAKFHNPAKDVMYDFDPELDVNMKASLKNYRDAKDRLQGKGKDKADVQLDSDVVSDPICSSAGCTQYKHEDKKLPYPINYPVPSWGQDRDI